MSKITFDVANENVDTVLLILENLKTGLLSNIEVTKKYTEWVITGPLCMSLLVKVWVIVKTIPLQNTTYFENLGLVQND